MTTQMSFLGRLPLATPLVGNFTIWQYRITLDPSVTSGEVGIGFSARSDIQDPASFPDLQEVVGTRLVTGLDSVQYVVIDLSAAVGGVLAVNVIAPPAVDTFAAVTLVNFQPAKGLSAVLDFATAAETTPNVTQVIEGPAAVKVAGHASPGGAPARLLPYASEPFGVYQPLIGWRSNLNRERLGRAAAQRFARALDLAEGVSAKEADRHVRLLDSPQVTDRTGTAVGRHLAAELSGSLPEGPEAWKAAVAKTDTSALGAATRAAQGHRDPAGEPQGTDRTREGAAAALLHHLGRTAPSVITEMFRPQVSEFSRVLSAADWFTGDHSARDAFLSPIGILHLFREYFFELGTFLGAPVGHVWVSPGGMLEVIEVNTRRTLVERTVEQSTETVQKTELSQTDQDEISDAVKTENASDTKLGVTASASGGVAGIFQASGSASFNLDSSRKQAQEQTHKRMREQSSKLSSEVRQNFKTSFRTVTETTDTSSRRYVLQNTTDRLVSYELSRKMRKVAVQVQDLGQQLCWQLYLDNPGDTLGIGEFVHAAAAALDAGLKAPDVQPYPDNQQKTYSLAIPFVLYQGADHDASDTYMTESSFRDHGIFSPDVGKDDIIQFRFAFDCPPAPSGFELESIAQIDFHGADVKFSVTDGDLLPNPDPATGKFQIRLTYANFDGKPNLPFDATMTYVPTSKAKAAIDTANGAAKTAYSDELAAKKEALFYDTLRTRLKLLGQVRPRPQDDLREEERDVIYRAIIARLYGKATGWSSEDYHLASELIRYLFDVDAMLYFVAPDWWRPRAQTLVSINDQGELQPTVVATPAVSDKVVDIGLIPPFTLPGHRPYYLITEETEPAPMGSSLGWLIQLDGDTNRNAFLNSPWVKAVLPIRPGREGDAIAWLGRPEVAGTDGLGDSYPYDAAADPVEYQGKTIEEVLVIIAGKIQAEYAASLVPVPTDPAAVNPSLALPTEMVFSHGFDPLAGGIAFGSGPFKVFSEWLEILPTDQVVATEYSLEGL